MFELRFQKQLARIKLKLPASPFGPCNPGIDVPGAPFDPSLPLSPFTPTFVLKNISLNKF